MLWFVLNYIDKQYNNGLNYCRDSYTKSVFRVILLNWKTSITASTFTFDTWNTFSQLYLTN